MQSHPDLAGADREQAEKRMARINVAANVLLDPVRRAAYDAHRRPPLWPREPPTREAQPEWVAPEPERRSWIPNSAELKALLSRIRPWPGRLMLDVSELSHGWPPKRQAVALAVCVVMALSLIVHARPRSLAFLYGKPPALGVASPKGV
jgi:curved DNA-binding protein CbpA